MTTPPFSHRKNDKDLQKKVSLNNIRRKVLSLLILFYVTILFFAGLMTRQFEKEVYQNNISSLQNVLRSTHNLIYEVWLKRQFAHGRLWSTNLPFHRHLEGLLDVKDDTAQLRSSAARKRMDAYFNSRLRAYDFLGATVILPDGTIIYSSYPERIGTRTPFLYYSDRIKTIFSGKEMFLPPLKLRISDIPDKFRDSTMSFPVMAIGVPVKDSTGRVIAALLLNKDPFGEFSVIANAGRFNKTVETYFINRNGFIVVKSDYRDQKVLLDSVNQIRHLINIRVSVPKKNANSVSVSHGTKEEMPLTLAASSVLAGKSGYSRKPYRDFRGTKVLGVWLWDDNLGIGMISEIDKKVALHPVLVTLRITLIFLGITFFITFLVFILTWKSFQRASRQVQESLRRFKTIFQSSRDALIIFDRTQVYDCNQAAVDLLGFKNKEEILRLRSKMYFTETIHTDNPREHIVRLMKAIKQKGAYRFESEFRLPNHKRLIADINITSLDYENKKVLMAAIRDVTSQKKVQQAIEEERQRLKKYLNTSMVVFAFVTKNREVVYANRRAREIFGVEEGILKKRILVDQQMRKELEKKLFEKQEEVVNLQIQAFDKNDRVVDMLASFFPAEHEGEKSYFTWIVDISDIKQIERELEEARDMAEAATRAKSDFLARMSHEIRTPMNAIIGLTHLTLLTPLEPRQKVNLQKVHSAAKTLLGILNDILDFSKIEAGKLELEITVFDLEKILLDLANIIVYNASQKGLELILSIAPDVPHFLKGDPLRLNQILINLANNAVKFTEQGEIIIRAEKREIRDNRIEILFSIRDTGIGLTPEEKEKLFQSFSQADVSTTRKYGGSGLGLAITRNLVEMMGGSIWVESEKGKGSTFFFTAWFEIEKDQKYLKTITSADLKDVRVLLVDDNETSLKLLGEALASFNLQVTPVLSGEEALTRLRKKGKTPYRIAIIDWYMPGMDGISLIRKIQSDPLIDPKPAVIMMSTYDTDENMRETVRKDLTLVVREFLTKPISYSTLFNAIMKVLDKNLRTGSSPAAEKTLPEKTLRQLKGHLVLLVEDNDVNQDVAMGMLEAVGMTADIAENGKIAVEMVKNSGIPSRYTLVLMDLQMPVMDGYRATREIRKMKAYRGLPILAMTSDAITGIKERCLEAGMNDFLTKPIDPDEFYLTLSKYISEEGSHTPVAKEPAPAGDTGIEEKTLAMIPGLKMEEALKRINHNIPLFLRLLQKFAVNYRNFAANLKKKLEAGELEEAERMVHTLKGVSGNIGAADIHRYAVLLDKKLKKNEKIDTAIVSEELNRLLNPLIGAIEDLAPSTDRKKKKKNAGGATDVSHLRLVLEELRTHLEEGDFLAVDRSEALEEFSGEKEWEDLLTGIRRDIMQYDFDAAMEKTDILLEMINSL